MAAALSTAVAFAHLLELPAKITYTGALWCGAAGSLNDVETIHDFGD